MASFVAPARTILPSLCFNWLTGMATSCLPTPRNSAGADDGVGDRFVRSNDDVVGFSDRLAFIVVDGLAREFGAWRSIPR